MTTKPKHTARLPEQPQWLGRHLDNIVVDVQQVADRSDQIMVYNLNGPDIVCHPGESPKTAARLWWEASKRGR